MPLFGEIFLSEVLKKPVFDPRGDELGRVKDVSVVKGDPLPRVSSVLVQKRSEIFKIDWYDIELFNRRIISSRLYLGELKPFVPSEEELLAVRDILDKQIVDANGVKVVRVNDIKIEGHNSEAVLVAVDVGVRGLLRRLGIERGGEDFLKVFGASLPFNLISWNYIQPLNPKLSEIALTVPRKMVAELHPADLAELLSQVSHEEGATFIKNLDLETAAETLSELETDDQTAVIKEMEPGKAAEIIEQMTPDDAADVLGELPPEHAQTILGTIDEELAKDIQELLSHEEDTAGGLMTTEYIAYPEGISVSEAIERFRKDAPEVETVYYIYGLDEEGRLSGVVSLRELMLAPPEARLSDVMEKKVKSVGPDEDEMEVARIISKYNIVALPVVDEKGALIGIVSIDDVVDRIVPPLARIRKRKV